MKQLQAQTNFTAGALSPRLWGHIDINKYKNGLKTAVNCLIMPQGPVQRRNGLEFINETKDSSKTSTLVRFQFDQDFAYMLEFGDLYIRFFRAGGQILSLGVPYEVVTTYTQTEVETINSVQFGRTLYLFHGNHAPAQLVWNSSDTSWTLSDIKFYPPATVEDGVKPTTTITPAATTGTGVNFTAGGPTFIASDVGRQIVNLVGTGKAAIKSLSSSSVAVADILEAFPNTSTIATGDWKLDLSPLATLTPSGSRIGSVITLTAGANTWRNDDLGRYILIHNGVVKITVITSATVVSGEVQKSLEAVTATSDWTNEETAWNSTNKYPAVGGIHQGRLFLGSTDHDPQTVWGSESGIFDSLGIGANDSDALSFDVSTRDVSQITWMMNIRSELAIGTSGAELTIDSGNTAGPITPTSLTQQVRGYNGANLQRVLGLDDEVIYVQRSSKKINAYRYDFNIDNYRSEDLLFLAEHLAESGIRAVAYAQDPDRHLYVVLNDGRMLVCTYIREQQVLGWCEITTDGEFESVNTISTGEIDEVWCIVKRTINGSTKRYIERFDYSTGETSVDGFSDSYLVYSVPRPITAITKANPGVVTAVAHGFNNGDHVKLIDIGGMTEAEGRTYVVANKAADTFELTSLAGSNINTTDFTTYTSGGNAHKLISTVSGLSHLAAKTVQIKADGAVHATKTVSAGAITLDAPAYQVTVGLSYETNIETLPQEFNLGQGSQQGQKARWVYPIIRLYKSALPIVSDSLLPARTPTDLMDKALPLFTGDAFYDSLTWKDGFANTLSIRTSDPMPLIVLGIFGSLEGGSQ